MRFQISCLTFLILMVLTSMAGADETATKKTVDDYLKSKTQYTGTMDIYDKDLDQVRRLRALEGESPDEEMETGVTRRFRDTSSGDIITVRFDLEGDGDEIEVSGIEMVSVEKPAPRSVEKKEYTDEEIQQEMKDYIAKMSRFTGTYDVFDPKIEKMRKMELLEFEPKVRRFGILRISTATFHDETMNKKVKVDIQVENKDGELSVKQVLIK